jgi:hypothetical protein
MKRTIYLILTFVAFLIIGCTNPNKDVEELTPEARQEIASSIRLSFNEMVKMLENHTLENVEKWINFYVESDDEAWMNEPVLWFNMLTVYPTKEAIRKVWTPTENSRLGTNMNIEEDYVAVLSPESATYVLKGTFSVIDTDGNTGADIPMSGIHVYVLRDDEWKIVHTHYSWEE